MTNISLDITTTDIRLSKIGATQNVDDKNLDYMPEIIQDLVNKLARVDPEWFFRDFTITSSRNTHAPHGRVVGIDCKPIYSQPVLSPDAEIHPAYAGEQTTVASR